MIALVLVFASNSVFTWVIPVACVWVASENQALNLPLWKKFYREIILAEEINNMCFVITEMVNLCKSTF